MAIFHFGGGRTFYWPAFKLAPSNHQQ
jgi:hypothetical protein